MKDKTVKVVDIDSVDDGEIIFSNGYILSTYHSQDCCESHYWSLSDLSIDDFNNLEFNLDGDFFERIDGYGIKLIPINGHPIPIPAYGYNNGYYSSELRLNISDENYNIIREFDITDCQVVY